MAGSYNNLNSTFVDNAVDITDLASNANVKTIATTKGDVLVATGAAALARLGVGTNGQVLTADSTQATGMRWADTIASVITSKGDLIAGTGSGAIARVPVGTDGLVLKADSTQVAGVVWATASAGTGLRGATKIVQSGSTATRVSTWNPDYTCDNNADDVEIQAAVDACYAKGGGTVMLSEGYFNLLASIKMKSNVRIIGQGWATRVMPQGSSFVGNALFEKASADQVAMGVMCMMLYGGVTHAQGYLHGIYVTGKTGGANANFETTKIPTSPDDSPIFEDLFIYNMKGCGILSSLNPSDTEASGFSSSNVRGAHINRVWVLAYRDNGFVWNGSDAFINAVVCGGSTSSTTGSGFILNGGNNRVVNSKSYYAAKHGLVLGGNRNMVVAFECQDNGWHGYYIDGDRNNVLAAVADSNGRLKSGNHGEGDGFYLASSAAQYCIISGTAFDRGQTAGSPQRYGIYFGGSNNQITLGINEANMTGPWGGSASARTGQNFVSITTTVADDEFRIGTGRTILHAPTTAIDDTLLGARNFAFRLDEANSRMILRVKLNDNVTLKTIYLPFQAAGTAG